MPRGKGSTKPGHHGPSQRQLRVGEELRHALSDILRRGELRDPALMDVNVTVTEVRISPDLKNATAFIMPLGGGHPEVIAALNKASAFLRSQVAKEVRLQHVPRLGFAADTSFDYATKIDRLLHDPAVARDLDPEGVPLDRDELLDADAEDYDTVEDGAEAEEEDEDPTAGEGADDSGDGRHGA